MRHHFKSISKFASLSLVLALAGCGAGGDTAAGATPLTSAQIQDATKSANSANWILSTVDTIQYIGFTYLANLQTLSGTNTTTTDLGTVCPNGGSYLATWLTNSTQYLTVGDTITLNLTNCVKSDGYTYNGSETYTITSATLPTPTTSEVIIKSVLDNLTVTTPQVMLSSTPLTTLSFSGTNMSFSRTQTLSNNTYTYPKTYKSTGNLTANMTTSAGNIASGTYTISNATANDVFSSSSAHSLAYSLTSSDGTFNNLVLTNTQPKESTSSGLVISAYPIYQVNYSGAQITATVSASGTTLSGTNSDGSTISNISLGSKYFY
jgi:hypothetical protein